MAKSRRSFLFVSVLACAATIGCAPSSAPSGAALCGARIARQWHGKTPNAKADEYAAYLGDGIKKFRTIKGNVGYQMMRETIGEETHFAVISYWESREAIHAYAGEDIRRTRMLPRDPEFLIDPEPTVMNYDVAATDFGCK
jgi:heme-degrading monooxygenase HmoA